MLYEYESIRLAGMVAIGINIQVCFARFFLQVRTFVINLHVNLSVQLLPPVAYVDCPASSFATKFVHVSTNKVRCSINKVLVSKKYKQFNQVRMYILKISDQVMKLFICLIFCCE